jgi:hypothetical protein
MLWDEFRVIVCEKRERVYRNMDQTTRRLRMTTHFMMDEDL